MSSVCISNCINDARDPRVPVRATYVSLYRWPESEAEFLRSARRNGNAPRVVDTISCRQMYLRSYTFSREEDHEEEKATPATQRCFGRVKETVSCGGKEGDDVIVDSRKRRRKKKRSNGTKRKRFVLRRMKDVSCSALFRFFHRLLSCAASVDVVDQKD